MPTATDITDDLKRRYYASEENQTLLAREMQHPAVRERVDAFMQSRGFPAPWSDEEYSTYFSLIFREGRERQRAYLSNMLSEDRVSLAVGNRVLGALIGSGLCRCLFTTNFDTVVEKAVADVSGVHLAAHHLEGAGSAIAALNNEDFPLYVKLHGDFRYDSIKNLAVDLEDQHQDLSRCLLTAANRFGLVVAGYSGRDKSVMDLLHEALNMPNPFPQGIHWLVMKGSEVPPPIATFIAAAADKGLEATLVEIDSFDTAMLHIWRHLEPRPEMYDLKVRKASSKVINIPRPVKQGGRPVLRYNALPIIRAPTNSWCMKPHRGIDWPTLQRAVRDAEGAVIATKDGDQIWAFGDLEDVADTFGLKRDDIFDYALPTDWRIDGRFHLKRFLEDALATALCRNRPLMTRRRGSQTWIVVDHNDDDVGSLEPLFHAVGKPTGQITGLKVPASDKGDGAEKVFFSEGVHISLTYADDRLWVLMTPDVWISPMFARRQAEDFLRRRKGNRYNKQHDELLSAWMGLFCGNIAPAETVVLTAFGDGSSNGDASFSVVNRTGFSWRALS